MKPYHEEMQDILARLEELGTQEYPRFRSYRREDGSWVDRESTPPYLEQMELVSRWKQLKACDDWLCPLRAWNRLEVGHQVRMLALSLSPGTSYVPALNRRIAASVYRNGGLDI